MLHNLKKRNEGFTIIEVMIVLAIAGLIMLIVFLAVPALQRNSRNTQRSNDASRIAGAVSECAGNENGRLTNCVTAANLDPYIDFSANQQLAGLGTASLTAAQITTSVKCNAAGTGTETSGNRSFVVLYQQETRTGGGVPRCVGG